MFCVNMNIFALDENPLTAAQMLCNKHVVKLIVESAQILSTAIHQINQERLGFDASSRYVRLYKPTHQKHPAVKWVRESIHNTDWLFHHANALIMEYTARYHKSHKTCRVMEEIAQLRWGMWKGFGDWRQHTPFAQCMPEKYRSDDAVVAYRAYYIGEKAKFAKWAPHAVQPVWWTHPGF